MQTKNIERYLESFGKYLVKQTRTNLTKGKKNVNRDLYNSIKFKVDEEKDGFSLKIYMLSYGKFVDKGVSGNKKRRSYKDYKGKVISSPYKYTTKQPPSGIIEKWISARRLKGRVDKNWKGAGNRGGQFITNKSFAFLIARKIKRDGIKGISFFQRPLELGLKRFGKDLLKNVAKDIIDTVNNQSTTE